MYCQKCGTKLDKDEDNQILIEEIAKFKEVIANYKEEVDEYSKCIHNAAHRMYRDWQKSRKRNEEAKLRDIAREVCKEMLLVEYEKRNKPKVALNRIPNRAGLPWTLPEDNILRDELCLFIKATAQDHARSYNAVSARLTKLYMDAAR